MGVRAWGEEVEGSHFDVRCAFAERALPLHTMCCRHCMPCLGVE